MLYVGQTHTVATTLPDGPPTREAIQAAFEASYRGAFGRLLQGIPARVMNLRLAVVGHRPKLDLAALAPQDSRPLEDCLLERRQVFAEGAFHDTPVYDRLALPVGAEITGPALLEQSDTTVFVDPGLVARVDRFGNLVIGRAATDGSAP